MKRIFIAATLTGLLGSAACRQAAPPEARPLPQMAAAQTAGIQTMVVKAQPTTDYLELSAKIQADPTKVIHIYPPVGGRVVSMQVKPGDSVTRGQTLATLESSDVTSARADYRQAMTNQELKEKSLKRAQLLYQHEVLAEKDLQTAQADYELAQADEARAESRLRILGIDPSGSSAMFPLRAPNSGVVLEIGAASGEFSKSLDAPAPLCTLADLREVWVVGNVFEKDVQGIRLDSEAAVTVAAYPGETWRGTVAALGDEVDPNTRTLSLRVVLPNPRLKLKPEMFATLRVVRTRTDGIRVPVTAVLRDGDDSGTVYVETSAGHYDKRQVALGMVQDKQVVILSGLQPGDHLVTQGALLIRDAA
jgi:membrane fusion protein, heavy metal efflux system